LKCSTLQAHEELGIRRARAAASDVFQDSATQLLGFGGKPAALVVVQPDWPTTELFS
jgi:hypothetical protein